MRYMIAIVAVALLAGCATSTGTSSGTRIDSTDSIDSVAQPDAREGIYEQVVRRYLTSPGENSFPEGTFKTVYVLDQAHPDAGRPHPDKQTPVPIPAGTQSRITAALQPTATVQFIADKETVLDHSTGCTQVKNGGILITLGTIDGDEREVKVGINGYVACLGATWLTYVVQNPAGTGWTVTGTTGEMAIS